MTTKTLTELKVKLYEAFDSSVAKGISAGNADDCSKYLKAAAKLADSIATNEMAVHQITSQVMDRSRKGY